MKQLLIVIFSIISVFYSCTIPSKGRDIRNSQATLSTLLDSVPQEKLPFLLEKDISDLYKYQTQYVDLNKLFSDSTILQEPFLYSNSPNQLQGSFYKRLEDKGRNKILLFTYFDSEYGSDGMSKTPTVELQVFDTNNELVDKMIVFAGIEGFSSWYRTFSIDTNYIITVNNKFILIDDSDEREATIDKEKILQRQYWISDGGKILDYFTESDGVVEKCEKIEFLNISWYSKGSIKNHVKDSKWIELNNIYEFNELIKQYVWCNYKNGIIVDEPVPLSDEEIESIPCLESNDSDS